MSKKKKPFLTAPFRQLMLYFGAAVYLDDPDELASLVMGPGDHTYRIPVDVARVLHSQLGGAIKRADEINEYKITYGHNPVWPFNCKDEE